MVHLRPAPVPIEGGRGRSFGDPAHDPVWARLAEAGIPVAFHLGDSGYEMFAGAWGAQDHFEAFRGVDMLSRLLVSDRPIHDTVGSMVVHGVFHRHPGLRIASIENGSDWLPLLVKRLHKLANQNPRAFARPARHHPPPRVGHAVLRGGSSPFGRPHRYGARSCSDRTGPMARAWPTR